MLAMGEGRMMKLKCVLRARSLLGEGALWDTEARVRWWLEFKCRLIHRLDPTTD
jgi:L-arabinonolactonase